MGKILNFSSLGKSHSPTYLDIKKIEKLYSQHVIFSEFFLSVEPLLLGYTVHRHFPPPSFPVIFCELLSWKGFRNAVGYKGILQNSTLITQESSMVERW